MIPTQGVISTKNFVIPLLTTVASHYGLTLTRNYQPLALPKISSLGLAAGFLVTVPVFIQAPLVRQWPLLSLGLTSVFWFMGWLLNQRSQTRSWGDLCIGFSWSWLAGSIYWGWFRWEPLWHLPIEAIALPLAVWGLRQRQGLIGHSFYLGSLIGTALTDGYFFCADLMTYWRQVMIVDPNFVDLVLHSALEQVHTPKGLTLATIFLSVLFSLGIWAWRQQQGHWQVFSGAIISTILVDSLFWLTAMMT